MGTVPKRVAWVVVWLFQEQRNRIISDVLDTSDDSRPSQSAAKYHQGDYPPVMSTCPPAL